MAHDDDPPTAGQAAHQLGPKLLPRLDFASSASPFPIPISQQSSRAGKWLLRKILSVQFLAFHLPCLYLLALLNVLNFIKVWRILCIGKLLQNSRRSPTCSQCFPDHWHQQQQHHQVLSWQLQHRLSHIKSSLNNQSDSDRLGQTQLIGPGSMLK